jgi:hypothetical protein
MFTSVFKSQRILLAALYLATPSVLFAEDMDLQGRVRLKVETNALKKGQFSYEGKIDAESERKNGTKGVLGLKARSKDDAKLFMEEAYIDHRLTEGKIQIGQNKKQFGLEYEYSERKRLTIDRSPIYQKIEEFAFVGHEPTVRYENLPSENGGPSYATSFGYSGSQEPYAIFFVNPKTDDTQFGAWTLFQGDRLNNATQLVGAVMLSAWSHEKPNSFEVETIYGIDPFETAWEREFTGRKVFFTGLKLGYGRWVAWGGEETNTQLVVQTNHIMHDTKTPDYSTSQFLLGVNYHVHDDFVIAGDIELIGKHSREADSDMNYDDSNIKIQVEYYL